jgi:hypothetical protein
MYYKDEVPELVWLIYDLFNNASSAAKIM